MANIGWLPKRCSNSECYYYAKCAISSCHHMAPSRDVVFIPEVDLKVGPTGITVHCLVFREKEEERSARKRKATRKRR